MIPLPLTCNKQSIVNYLVPAKGAGLGADGKRGTMVEERSHTSGGDQSWNTEGQKQLHYELCRLGCLIFVKMNVQAEFKF